jgi:hypothetical protein
MDIVRPLAMSHLLLHASLQCQVQQGIKPRKEQWQMLSWYQLLLLLQYYSCKGAFHSIAWVA